MNLSLKKNGGSLWKNPEIPHLKTDPVEGWGRDLWLSVAVLGYLCKARGLATPRERVSPRSHSSPSVVSAELSFLGSV